MAAVLRPNLKNRKRFGGVVDGYKHHKAESISGGHKAQLSWELNRGVELSYLTLPHPVPNKPGAGQSSEAVS